MNEEFADIMDRLGEVLTGLTMPDVLTALTYLIADVVVQSEIPVDKFMVEFNTNMLNAINEIEEYEDGNRSYH